MEPETFVKPVSDVGSHPPRTVDAFQRVACHSLAMPTGIRVRDAQGLLEEMRRASDTVLERHLMQCYLRRDFQVAGFPNDLALWAAESLQDIPLAEALSGIDPYRARDWNDIRRQVVEILEEQIWENGGAAAVARPGRELFLEDAVTIVVETDSFAHDLVELRDLIAESSLATIYHHVHGGTFRDPGARDDFSAWLESSLGLADLARRLDAIDFPYYTLEELKAEILGVLESALAAEEGR